MVSAAQRRNENAEVRSVFANRLALFRKQRGLTQAELAEKAGLIQTIISDYERGRLRPYADTVANFAAVLGVSADELLGLKETQDDAPPVSRRFLRRLEKVDSLPRRDQDALLRTIDAFLVAKNRNAS